MPDVKTCVGEKILGEVEECGRVYVRVEVKGEVLEATKFEVRAKGHCLIKDKKTGGAPREEENPAAAAGRDGIACASIWTADPSTTVRLALERWASDIAASSTQHSPAAGDLKGQPSAACHR